MGSRRGLRASLPAEDATRPHARSALRIIATLAGLTAAGVVLTAASAFAAPLVTGGADAAPTGLRVQPGAVADLYPGAVGDLTLLVSNPGSEPVTTSSVSRLSTTVTGGLGACSAADFDVRVRDVPAVQLPSGATREVVLPGAVRMRATAGDGCQGSSVRVQVRVTARRVAAA